jgi:glycosyltransferase involved in cell wall biosynthesis
MIKTKILFDLKPALDGYAGIPQETRLLFAGLLNLGNKYITEGLLQHGSSALAPNIISKSVILPAAERLFRHSQSVISFYGSSRTGFPAALIKKIKKYLTVKRLRWQAYKEKSLDLGFFEGNLFDDFIWSRLFSKTLKSEQRQEVVRANHRILGPSRRMMHDVGLKGVSRFHKPQYLTFDTRGYDFFIAQTPFPGRVSKGTQLVIRYHDAVPVLMPHTIGDKAFHQTSHFYALRDNVASGAWFSCVSEATRSDLIKLFPEVAARAVAIPNIFSDAYFYDATSKQEQALKIIYNRIHCEVNMAAGNTVNQFKPAASFTLHYDYLLMVSTLEPRKNHQLLIQAWERLKYSHNSELKLVIVGGQGWDYEPIIQSFKPWIEQGELFHLSNVPSSELRVLYQHAAATICPSIAEGFDYSGIEAMCCGGLVLASDIPVHREIYGDASVYFDPYDPEQAAERISYILGTEGQAKALLLKGTAKTVISKYTHQSILPLWEAFFKHCTKSEL